GPDRSPRPVHRTAMTEGTFADDAGGLHGHSERPVETIGEIRGHPAVTAERRIKASVASEPNDCEASVPREVAGGSGCHELAVRLDGDVVCSVIARSDVD